MQEQADDKRRITVGVDPSLKPSERQVIGSVCKLSTCRSNHSPDNINNAYETIPLTEEACADIWIINYDQNRTKLKKLANSAKKEDVPVILICKELPAKVPKSYHLLIKKKLGSLLLAKLDKIAVNFKLSSRCLVVEESKKVRKQMSMILKDLNVKAFFSEDGEGGILRAKGQQYDLIFLDSTLPDMDGFEVCKALKKNAKTANIPVVMLTSKGSPFSRMRGSIVGCDRTLVKPINAQKVGETIEHFRRI